MPVEYFVLTWDNEGTDADDAELSELLSQRSREGWTIKQILSCPGRLRKVNLGYSNADGSRDRYRITPALTIFLERIVK